MIQRAIARQEEVSGSVFCGFAAAHSGEPTAFREFVDYFEEAVPPLIWRRSLLNRFFGPNGKP